MKAHVERAVSVMRLWRLLLIATGAVLLLAGFHFHNQAMQVAGFLISVFGAFGGG